MDTLLVSTANDTITKILTISAQSQLDALILKPELAPLLSLVKGARNGIVYGSKVRFPHALVYVGRRTTGRHDITNS
jgi:hypothetical protein